VIARVRLQRKGLKDDKTKDWKTKSWGTSACAILACNPTGGRSEHVRHWLAAARDPLVNRAAEPQRAAA